MKVRDVVWYYTIKGTSIFWILFSQYHAMAQPKEADD
jgi:hypothetical protein